MGGQGVGVGQGDKAASLSVSACRTEMCASPVGVHSAAPLPPHPPLPTAPLLQYVAEQLFNVELTNQAAELFQEHADEMGAMRGH